MKLSICIPTYNRQSRVLKQTKFILDELKYLNYPDNVELLIRDNASQDGTLNSLGSINQNNYFRVLENQENIGLIGNLSALIDDSVGEYIWFIGDDDHLYKGILRHVLNNLTGEGLLFLNHRAVNENGDILLECAFNKKNNNTLHHVFRFSGTTMMFITACVYRADLLRKVRNKYKNDLRITFPLTASLYCSEVGGFSVSYEIFIDNLWESTSWNDISESVFYRDVPKELLRSISYSKSKINAMMSVIHYLKSSYKRIIKYQFYQINK